MQIYDVGDYEQQLYLAMEFVEGMPLHDWTKERDPSRSWRDVLAVYIPAGRGLAAAHRAGLVHRDFKPESRSPPPELPQPADRSLSHGFGCSGGGGLPVVVP